jgi:hypothetical protein
MACGEVLDLDSSTVREGQARAGLVTRGRSNMILLADFFSD